MFAVNAFMCPRLFIARLARVSLLASALWLVACSLNVPAENVAAAPARKALHQVVVDDLVSDTQILRTDAAGLAQAWWIPLEFWQASLGRINPQLAQQVETVLGEYSIVAVVQADVSALGGFVFYPREEIQPRLTLTWQRAGVEERVLQLVPNPNLAVRNLIQQLTPLLGRSMGEMGRNLQFFVLADRDEQGQRIVNPYEPGLLTIHLAASEAQPATDLNLDLPLNALYEPRYCANGKPAHITWRYCPWDGKPLQQ